MLEYNHLTMKNLPNSDKPYEKLAKYGEVVLSDTELLAIILRTGTKNRTVVELAQNLLLMDKNDLGIVSLYNKSITDLQKIKGIGFVKSVQIRAIMEISKRISKCKALEKVKINSPSSVARVYMEEMRYLTKEYFKLVFLDTKNQIISDKTITIGSVNASIVNPRDVFIEALKNNAVNIIMLHNHPSGDPYPSNEDIQITKRIKECGQLIGIALIDHLIIGDGKYFSLKEKGII